MFRILLVIICLSTFTVFGVRYYKSYRAEIQAKAVAEQQLQEKKRIEQEKLQRKNAVEQEVKGLIAAMVKDPTSVQFRNMSVAIDMPEEEINLLADQESYVDAVCGEFNAKNSYGGYVGFKPFSWNSNKENPLLGSHSHDGMSSLLQDLAIKECLKIKNYVEANP